MNKFKELIVWQKAVELAAEIYKMTSTFPAEEKFGLTSQINRCSISIASNIAEGAGRNSENEFVHFIGIAVGSTFELETQLIIANKIQFISDEKLAGVISQVNDIQNMLFGLKKAIKNNKQ